MRLLWITGRFPLPPVKGDKLRAWHLMRQLSARHQIDVVSFISASEVAERPKLERVVHSLQAIPFSRVRGAAQLLRHGAGSVPLQVAYFTDARIRAAVERLLKQNPYDAIVCTLMRQAENLPRQPGIPVVMDMIDSMVLNFRNRLERQRGPMRLVVKEELRRLERYEPAVARRMDRIVFVSERDREALGVPNAVVIPMGVDTEHFAPRPGTARGRRIVFTGNLSYFPNVDAACHFAEEIFPLVRRRDPAVTFEIAGVNPSRTIQALGRLEGVRVVGFVDDMAAFLNSSAVAVCPLRSGSGQQIKVLEAMACGVPVVASTYATEGLRAAAGEEYLLANDPESFAEQVLKLLDDDELARRLGGAGRRHVGMHHGWEQSARQLEAEIESAVTERAKQHVST